MVLLKNPPLTFTSSLPPPYEVVEEFDPLGEDFDTESLGGYETASEYVDLPLKRPHYCDNGADEH